MGKCCHQMVVAKESRKKGRIIFNYLDLKKRGGKEKEGSIRMTFQKWVCTLCGEAVWLPISLELLYDQDGFSKKGSLRNIRVAFDQDP